MSDSEQENGTEDECNWNGNAEMDVKKGEIWNENTAYEVVRKSGIHCRKNEGELVEIVRTCYVEVVRGIMEMNVIFLLEKEIEEKVICNRWK